MDASSPPPLAFQWDGEAMIPRHPRLADKHFVVGEVYTIEVREDRSAASHRHYFAALNEAHASLPEHISERFPTMDHLRKYALIKAGYRDERSHACSSKAEALRFAAFVQPMDSFAFITTDGPLVTVFTAKSQSVRAMGKQAFEASKTAVLDYIASLIGHTAGTLERHTSEAA